MAGMEAKTRHRGVPADNLVTLQSFSRNVQPQGTFVMTLLLILPLNRCETSLFVEADGYIAPGQDWRWQQDKRQRGGGHAAPSPGRPGVVKDERRTVYVGNLPYRASEDDIEALFSTAGRVVDVRRGAGPDGAPASLCTPRGLPLGQLLLGSSPLDSQKPICFTPQPATRVRSVLRKRKFRPA